jgi:hypothetical protein
MAGELNKRIQQIIKDSDPTSLAKVGYAEWTAKTPVGKPGTWKSAAPKGYVPGNAKKSTRLNNETIHADYAYAKRLDNGWSKQFGGQGMSKPALAAVAAYIRRQFKKKGI